MKKLILLLYVTIFSFSALSQNVGVSSNILFNPQYTLDVDGVFKVSNYASVGVNPNPSYRFYAYNSSNNYARLGSNQYGVYARGSSSAIWGINSTINGHAVRAEQTSTGYAIYADGANSRNYFQGNVGIGSFSPNSKLEVIGSALGEISSAIYGELDITDAQGIGVVGIGGYNGIQGNVFPIGNQIYYGTSGNVISTTGTGTNIGIYGRAEGGGLNYAGYFLGDVLITGLGGGGFKGVAADINGLLRPTNGIGTAPIRVCTTTTTTVPGAGTAQVGTATTTTSTTGETPFTTFYHDQRTQYVFTAAELTAAGLLPGNITALAFNISSTGSPQMSNFSLRIGATANATAQTLDWITGLTQVWSGTWNPSTGWQTLTFTTPFNWNGTSNIAVAICFDNTSWSTNFGVQYTTATNMVYNRYRDNGTGCSLTWTEGSIGNANQRANVRFSGQISVTTTSTTCSDQNRIQRIIRGTVNADASIAGGGGFSVAKDGAGRYRITFTTPFADIPSASATQIFTGVGSVAATNSGSTLDNAVIYGISSTGINIATGNSSGTVGDRSFSFIVIGSE
jgi:hypothetical protein